MRSVKCAACHNHISRNISSRLIIMLILIGAQLLSCATAQTNCLFIHWENNTVMLDGKYTIEVMYSDSNSPPPQPYEKIPLIRDLVGDLIVQLGSDFFVLDPQYVSLDTQRSILRPEFKPVVRGKRAKLNINYHDEGKISGSKAIRFNVI
jgi:hypothetical protein